VAGIQFATDDSARKVAVQIDLKRYRAILEDFWDGLISESRRKEKGRALEKIRLCTSECRSLENARNQANRNLTLAAENAHKLRQRRRRARRSTAAPSYPR